MIGRRAVALLILGLATSPAKVTADEFDRLEGPAFAAIVDGPSAKPFDRLGVDEIGHQPALLAGTRSPLIVVRTDQGNLAGLLASSAFRKPPGGPGEPVPVLVLERFATYEPGPGSSRLARGEGLLLFDGFRVDLDTGQVVPDGQGGDLQFLSKGPDGPHLEGLGGAKLILPAEKPALPASTAPGPSPGRTVLPGDFAGRYRLFADGQWSGTLELTVEPRGAVSGRFRSDLQGSTYPVTGQVGPEVPHRVRFTVNYPRAQHDFEGYLWTEGKAAIAGTVTLLDRPSGFFALREGIPFDPTGPIARP